MQAGNTPAPRNDPTYADVAWICSHNAFCNFEDGWWLAQQSGSVTAQMLSHGSRALMLDVWRSAITDDPPRYEIYLKHGPLPTMRRLVDTLAEIDAFLDEHPQEIVTVMFENNVVPESYDLLNERLRHSSLYPKMFFFDRENHGDGDMWDPRLRGAPTLSWMRTHNKRCVIFSDAKSSGSPTTERQGPDELPMLWAFCKESVFGAKSLDEATWARERDESAAAYRHDRGLAILNHFPALDASLSMDALRAAFGERNRAETLTRQILAWESAHGRAPNFIAVDFVEMGQAGGVRKAVEFAQARLTYPEGQGWPVGSLRPVTRWEEFPDGCARRVKITFISYLQESLTLVGSRMVHGRTTVDFPERIPGRWSDELALADATGSITSVGMSTVRLGSLGPKGFWLYRIGPSFSESYLFIAGHMPFNLWFYNSYANARLLKRSDVQGYLDGATTADDFFEAQYREENEVVAQDASVRVRARSSITSTSKLSVSDVGQMNVWIWNY